jgi:hypothetical protein
MKDLDILKQLMSGNHLEQADIQRAYILTKQLHNEAIRRRLAFGKFDEVRK